MAREKKQGGTLAKGRPTKYSESEEFKNKVDGYFDWCDSETKTIMTDKGMQIIYKPYTVSGLCLYLDICRDTLCEYEKKEDFSDTIKKAKNRIENFIEEKSITGYLNPTVSIFNLKNNFGWKDKQEIDQNIGNKDDKPFETKNNLDKLSLEDLKQLQSILKKADN